MNKQLEKFILKHEKYVLVHDIKKVKRGNRIDIVYSVSLCNKFETYTYNELDDECDGASYVSFDDAEKDLLRDMLKLELIKEINYE